MKRKAVIFITAMIFVFVFCVLKMAAVQESKEKRQQAIQEQTVQEKDKEQDKEQPKDTAGFVETWGNTKKSIKNYKETKVEYKGQPSLFYNYYVETGIWETMLDADNRLFSFGVKDRIMEPTLIFLDSNKMTEEVLPCFKKKKLKYSGSLIPYYNGKQKGYAILQDKICYILGRKGDIAGKINLGKYIKQGIKDGKMEKVGKNNADGYVEYTLKDIIQTGKNRIGVNILSCKEDMGYGKKVGTDRSYLLEIDVKKDRLISLKKLDYYLIGADKKYYYGLQFAEKEVEWGFFSSFKNGCFLIEDRKTGKRAAEAEVPNDAVSDDIGPSQCFDIKDETVWLANRTGVYFLKPGDMEWTMVMSPEQSQYLSRKYTICDITVKNENTFYLLIMYGDDEETADILTRYTKRKKK